MHTAMRCNALLQVEIKIEKQGILATQLQNIAPHCTTLYQCTTLPFSACLQHTALLQHRCNTATHCHFARRGMNQVGDV